MNDKVCIVLCSLTVAIVASARAEWYWPFSSDNENKPPRLSELMEPATVLIDEASDLAGEGKVSEAAEKYRAALKELDRIEQAASDRAKTPEFATLRTKRAYVNAAIDSMLMSQAKNNAKTVAVSDTSELEQKLAKEKNIKPVVKVEKKKRALTTVERIMNQIGEREYERAEGEIAAILKKNPNDVTALNLRAAKEAHQGRFADAERTLDRAIQSHPRDYHAYYNMATLYLQSKTDALDGARRYYETGRAMGGPEDVELKAALEK